MKGKTGWREQLLNDEYPDTKKSYGQDLEALHGYKQTKIPSAYERTKLQKTCTKCGREYWADKGCSFCKLNSTKIPSTEYSVLCRLCGYRDHVDDKYLFDTLHVTKRFSKYEPTRLVGKLRCRKCGRADCFIQEL
jgi:hypothetical protein